MPDEPESTGRFLSRCLRNFTATTSTGAAADSYALSRSMLP